MKTRAQGPKAFDGKVPELPFLKGQQWEQVAEVVAKGVNTPWTTSFSVGRHPRRSSRRPTAAISSAPGGCLGARTLPSMARR